MTETATNDSPQQPAAKVETPILAMDNVVLRQPASKIGRLRRFSLTLRPGSVALIHRPSLLSKTLLVDAAMGMAEPRQGVVKFMHNNWAQIPYQQQLTLRSQVGRIFECGGWMSNLSLPDNLRLQLRHHTTESERVLSEKLTTLSKRFGVKIPDTRAAFVQDDVLRICQWIRAFVCQPKLLIAENPFDKVPNQFHRSFNDAEFDHRKRGGATLWITDNPFIWQRDLRGDVTRYKINGDRIEQVA